MATFAIAVSVSGLIYDWIHTGSLTFGVSTLAVVSSLAAFTLLNHFLVGLVIWFARGQNFTQSGIFGGLTLMIDFTLLSLGMVAGKIWSIEPPAALLVFIPLYLIYTTLKVPSLQRQTEIDPKTKLYNARYFAEALKKEYERALRYDRPLTVVIGDLDLLRNINNTYGHLAGDVVLVGVAEILQENFRGYDLVARFGGEEFAIMMPETTPEEAFPRVEAVRQAIAAAEFEVSTSVTPIKATVSFGIAARDGQDSAEEIVHDADVALYRSKLMGRNVTCIHPSENIEELFEGIDVDANEAPAGSFDARLPATQYISQPNPLREVHEVEQKTPVQKSSPPTVAKSLPLGRMNGFIALVATLAIGLGIFVLPNSPIPDWFGLFAFSLIILLSEGLSLDIYVNDTSISTSTAPLIAGTLLFGPIGALVLSLVLAGTAMIKHRSQLHRFIFNSANHFLSAFLGTFLLLFFREPFIAQPTITQIAFAILAGNVIFLCSTILLATVMSLSMGQPVREIWMGAFPLVMAVLYRLWCGCVRARSGLFVCRRAGCCRCDGSAIDAPFQPGPVPQQN